MDKTAYKKFCYYIKSIPDYKSEDLQSINFYYGLVNKGMAGIELLLFSSKEKLYSFTENRRKKLVKEGSASFLIGCEYNEQEKQRLQEYLENWSDLYDEIKRCQEYNKIHHHWEYRDYNFLWRVVIIQAREAIAGFKRDNSEIFEHEFHLIEGEESLQLLKDLITNIKLIENTVEYIETTIKKTNFYEDDEILIPFKHSDNLKIEALEKLNMVFNYIHPTSMRYVPWMRGIKVEYKERQDRYDVYVQVLYKGPKVRFNHGVRTPKEAFEEQFILKKENIKFHYQKLKTVIMPCNQKYIYPFWMVNDIGSNIEKLIVEFKDEVNYNLNFANDKMGKYYSRITHILDRLFYTKSQLEKILKPFKPSKFDPKFLEYLDTIVDKEKLDFSPWCRYHHDEHVLVYCVEQQHENVKKLIKILEIFLEKKNSDCIKFSYSSFDDLFMIVDSSFVMRMMEEFGITQKGIYNLDKKKLGAIRGIVEALMEKNLVSSDNLIKKVDSFAFHIKAPRIKKALGVSDTSTSYRRRALKYIEQELHTEEVSSYQIE